MHFFTKKWNYPDRNVRIYLSLPCYWNRQRKRVRRCKKKVTVVEYNPVDFTSFLAQTLLVRLSPAEMLPVLYSFSLSLHLVLFSTQLLVGSEILIYVSSNVVDFAYFFFSSFCMQVLCGLYYMHCCIFFSFFFFVFRNAGRGLTL